MARKFECKNCGKDIIVKYVKVGELAQCPRCGTENIVPNDATATDEEPDYIKPRQPVQPTELTASEQQTVVKSVLGPHTLGSVLFNMFGIYGKNILPMLGIVVFVYIITLVPTAAFAITMIKTYGAIGVPPRDFFIMLYLVIIPLALITLLLSIVRDGIITFMTIEQYVHSTSIKSAWSVLNKKYWTLIGGSLLRYLAIAGMAITIIGLPFAVYYCVCWLFVPPVIIVEGCGAVQSLKRSHELVKDDVWHVFGISVVVGLIGVGISLVAYFMPIINFIVFILVTPIPVIASTLLYLDVRVRKEGYNPEALRRDIDLVSRDESMMHGKDSDTG